MSNGPPSPALRAALYASLHTGTPGDREYYVRQCEGVESILELACGSGRILHAVEASALRVGMDIDIELLRLARAGDATNETNAPQWLCGDMRDFHLAQRFDRILLPYTSLYCLSDMDELMRCFGRVREHLTPNGRFIFDAYCADGMHAQGDAEEGLVEDAPDDRDLDGGDVGVIEVDGTIYHVREESEWDAKRQRLDVVYAYEPRSGGYSIADTIHHHYLQLAQLEPLLRSAGLELVSLEGDFSGAPAKSTSDHFVAVASAR